MPLFFLGRNSLSGLDCLTTKMTTILFNMVRHPVSSEDLVLQVQRPHPTDRDHRSDFEVKAFGSRRNSDNALGQVKTAEPASRCS